ncbi:MAG: hypothetical protein O2809_01615 [Proteobacteria bacterium]|nr:hypothetical protein [Pseudomonadota bacterium]
MENFDLNKLYYDKDGTKLYGHDMVRLAINHLFIKQRTGVIKLSIWSVIIGSALFLYLYLLFSPSINGKIVGQTSYLLKVMPDWLVVVSILLGILGALWALFSLIHLIKHSIGYVLFASSDEFKKRSIGLNNYKNALRKMSSTAKKQLIDKAKQTILNTPNIRQAFERQHEKLSSAISSVNQTANNISQATNNMAYTAHQQIYSGFDSLNFGNNNNNKNNSII